MSRRLTTALAAFTMMVPLGLAATAFAGGESSGQSDKTEKSTHQGGASGGGANSDCGAYCPTQDEGRQGNGNAPQNGSVGKADSKNPPGQRPNGGDRNRGYECDRQTGVGDGNPAHTGCADSGTETTRSTSERGRPAKPVTRGKPAKPVGRGKAAKPAKPISRGKSAKPAKPISRGKSAKPGKPVSRGKARAHGKAAKPDRAGKPGASRGKTTICHATGSSTNPYVLITIANSALAAHRRHQHGEDIIPAPAGGCPAPEERSTPLVPGPEGPGKTTICHATGSSTNPYVMITIADAALDAHRSHQHGEDIIPAPAEGCPGPGFTAEGLPLPAGGNPIAGMILGLVDALRPGQKPSAAPPAGGVLGEFAQGGPDDGAAAPASAQGGPDRRESGSDAPSASSRLPFTGLELAIVAALGLAAILAGIALYRSSSRGAA